MFIRTNSHAISHRLNANQSTKLSSKRKLRRVFMRSRKRVVRYSLLTANLALLAIVVFFVAKSPSTRSQAINRNSNAGAASAQTVTGPLDQVSSADIAVHIARTAGLPESNSVVNHADSISATEATAPADTTVVAKPQVVSAALPSRKDIQSYTAQAGDSITSIATKFGVTSESIRGSNGLTNDRIPAGPYVYTCYIWNHSC